MSALSHSTSDSYIIRSILECDDTMLSWLASMTRDQQWFMLNDVKTLCLTCRNMGPRGALELLYQVHTWMKTQAIPIR